MRFKLMALVASVSFAVPAVAQTTDSPSAAPAPSKEKKICRRVDQTGSIIGGRRVCHTKVEWTQIDDANGRAAQDSLQRQRDSRPQRSEG